MLARNPDACLSGLLKDATQSINCSAARNQKIFEPIGLVQL
jgi:hypothetical protein